MRGLDAVRRKCQPPLPEKHGAGHGVLCLYQIISNLLIFPWTRVIKLLVIEHDAARITEHLFEA